MAWLWDTATGQPGPSDDAAALRSQQQFGETDGGSLVESPDPADLANQIRAAYPGQSFQELISSGAVDVSEASPEEIQALLAFE
jgi:hypothetical protein